MRHLPEDVVVVYGLTTPKEEYTHSSYGDVLNKKRAQVDGVYPFIEDVWEDVRVQFMVICGGDVFSSETDVLEFDVARFAETVPTKPIVIMRPFPGTSPMIWDRWFPLP